MSQYSTSEKLQHTLTFLEDNELTKYVQAYYASKYSLTVDFDRQDIPDDVFRKMKRLFGERTEDGIYRFKVVGSYDKTFEGKRTFFEGTEGTFNLCVTVKNPLVCEQVDVSQGVSDSQWAAIRRRIENGAIPVTICDPVEFKGEVGE